MTTLIARLILELFLGLKSKIMLIIIIILELTGISSKAKIGVKSLQCIIYRYTYLK